MTMPSNRPWAANKETDHHADKKLLADPHETLPSQELSPTLHAGKQNKHLYETYNNYLAKLMAYMPNFCIS